MTDCATQASADYIDFIHAKVFFEVDHGDMHHDDRAINHFIGHLLQHPEYANKLRAMVQPAFAEMMRAITAKKSVAVSRAEIETLLRAAVAAGIASEKKITLWLQNWTSEIFDAPAITRSIGQLTLTGQRAKCPRRRCGITNSFRN